MKRVVGGKTLEARQRPGGWWIVTVDGEIWRRPGGEGPRMFVDAERALDAAERQIPLEAAEVLDAVRGFVARGQAAQNEVDQLVTAAQVKACPNYTATGENIVSHISKEHYECRICGVKWSTPELLPPTLQEALCDAFLRRASEQLPNVLPYVCVLAVGQGAGGGVYSVSNLPPSRVLELLERAIETIKARALIARHVEPLDG